MIAVTKRQLVGLVGAASLGTSLPEIARADKTPFFVSSRRTENGNEAVLVDSRGAVFAHFPLRGRGHGSAVSPDGKVVMFARRPGRFALVLDSRNGQLIANLQPPDGRHFYGHGCFSPNGKLLFASENDFENVRGKISVWDVPGGFRRIAEFNSHGIGPHEIVLMPDGKTLAVANGGIETHPDSGRLKLNIPDMKPNLTFIDARGGKLVKKQTLPRDLHKLSIRHLAARPNGDVVVATQYEGPTTDDPPLVFIANHNGLKNINLPIAQLAGLKNYCGSVVIDKSDSFVGITSPRGSRTVFWSLSENRFAGAHQLQDCCGLARGFRPATFAISSGDGQLIEYDAAKNTSRQLAINGKTAWDNHLTQIWK